ncbi:MAG TPA: hypothetical protein VH599_16405 [Ktedonobacterales bacterium]|jgi:hypothetical protein
MCVSCGCGQVNDDHGDDRNITMKDMRSAAQAADIDVQTAARNIQQAMSQGGGMGKQQPQMGGQSYGAQPGMGQGPGASRPGGGPGGQQRQAQGFGLGDYPETDQPEEYRSRETDF